MAVQQRSFSKITDAVAAWSNIRQLIRGGDEGKLVPVVIPKDNRGIGWMVLFLAALYLTGTAAFSSGMTAAFAWIAAAVALVAAAIGLWRGSIVEIEQGTTGVRSRYEIGRAHV